MYIKNRVVLIVFLVAVVLCEIAFTQDTKNHRPYKIKNVAIVEISHWSIKNSNQKLNRNNDVLWIGKNQSQLFGDIGDGVTLGLPIERNEGFDLSGLLNHKLLKNYCYAIEFEFQASENDSLLKRIGITFSPLLPEEGIDYPLFRFSNYDLDSIVPNHWKSFSIPFIARGNETKLVIRCIQDYLPVNNVEAKNACLIRNIHLKIIGNISEIDSNNYVINGDFEYYKFCPSIFFSGEGNFYYWQKDELLKYKCLCIREHRDGILQYYNDYSKLSVYGVLLGSPDLYCSSSNFSVKMPRPYSGRCYAMINLYVDGIGKGQAYGEYLQTELRDTLQKKQDYKISFVYQRAPFSELATNTLGIKLTQCPFSMDSLHFLHVMPDGDLLVSDSTLVDDTTWKTASFIYHAKGGEKYITIGPFWADGEKGRIEKMSRQAEPGTAYYLIDNVRLIKVK